MADQSMTQRQEAQVWCCIGNLAFAGMLLMSVTQGQKAASFAGMAVCAAAGWWLADTPFRRSAAWFAFWAAFAGLFIVTASPARAQNAPTYRSAYVPMFDRDDDWHYRRTAKVYRRSWSDADHGDRMQRCKARLAIVGDQYASEKGAREEADKAWMQTARWQHGERYMARDHARDAAYECGRSSVGSVVGQVFFRCRLTARPCRAPSRGDE